MKKHILLFSIAAAALLLAHCTSDKKSDNEQKEDYVQASSSPDSLCIVNPSWFPHSQTPPPPEGKGSPFDDSSTTNQIFHQWSWNKFLWLTKPDSSFGGNPLFLNPLRVRQVTSLMAPVAPRAGVLIVLEDTNQAGGGPPMLKTNAGYGGTSQTVYYSIHMNDLMYAAGLKFAKEIVDSIIPINNEVQFPVGSFEMKVAWVPVAAIPVAKQSKYYIANAAISSNGGQSYTNTKVALIGMHVVGVVENHPEFIWATFEHDDLSPDYDWAIDSASSPEDLLVFKKGSVSGINGIVFNKNTKLGTLPYQVFDLYQFGVPRDSGGQFMTTSQAEPVNFNNVAGINKCVKGQLNDVWNNYFYNGSLWLNMDGTTPQQQALLIDSLSKLGTMSSVLPGGPARGSMNCANVTMESFTQTFQSNISNISVANLANCFSCHSGQSFGKISGLSPLYLSHSFQGYLENLKGTPVKEIENLKTKQEERILLFSRSKK